MKTLISILLLFFIFQNSIYSNYIVISNGVILEGEDIHEIQSVASISKVMTALIAIEYGNITDEVLISKEASLQIGSSLYTKENERYSLLSLIYGLLLRSGNDAAYAIAMNVGGSIEGFVAMMNDKAREIGMKNTLFSNPSGLDEFDHGNQSTVYDMALCMQEAMNNDIFKTIINTKQYKAENQRIWTNKNRIFNLYEYANGGKTGYTQLSGKTLITSAKKDDLESIVVSFREDDYYMLHKRLHEKVASDYQIITLIEKGIYTRNHQQIIIDEDIKIIIKKEDMITFNTKKDNNEYQLSYQQLNETIHRKVILHDNILE